MVEGRQIVKKYEDPVRSIGYYTAPTTTTEIWAPSAGNKAIITDIIVSTSAQSNVNILCGTSSIVIGPLFCAANDKFHHTFMEPVECSMNESVTVTASAGTSSILLMGREE